VRFVAHLDLPKSIEGYYQETGRAGRDGLPADAWMAYGLADVVQQRRLIELSDADDDYKRVSATKLDALLGLCETAGCRRVRLLAYFGETSAPCGNCDNCLDPPQTWDATVAAQKALSAIYRTGQRFGAVHVIGVLRGELNDRTQRLGHDRLPVFGVGADLDEVAWRGVFRQLVALGFATVDHAAHGALKLTEASRPVLRGEVQVDMRPTVTRTRPARGARRAAAADLPPPDAGLFERLKTWRLAETRAQGVPAYVILHDSALAEIARRRPSDLRSLADIAGIGAKKLERYGPALVDIVRGAG
jgi:ATP-dependent DNA helicase RecQ